MNIECATIEYKNKQEKKRPLESSLERHIKNNWKTLQYGDQSYMDEDMIKNIITVLINCQARIGSY